MVLPVPFDAAAPLHSHVPGVKLDLPYESALVAAALVSFAFPLSLYVWRLPDLFSSRRSPSARATRAAPARDSPASEGLRDLNRRALSVFVVFGGAACWVASKVEPVVCIHALPAGAGVAAPCAAALLGLPSLCKPLGLSGWLRETGAIAAASAATQFLFLGPLAHKLVDGGARNGSTLLRASLRLVRREVLSPTVWRDRWTSASARKALFVAPLAEELVFRGVVFTLLRAGGAVTAPPLLVQSMLFALAHTHHFMGVARLTGSKAAAASQIAATVCYTTFFGSIAALLFVRSGSIAGAIVSHSLCNAYGAPQVDRCLCALEVGGRQEKVATLMHVVGLVGFVAWAWWG